MKFICITLALFIVSCGAEDKKKQTESEKPKVVVETPEEMDISDKFDSSRYSIDCAVTEDSNGKMVYSSKMNLKVSEDSAVSESYPYFLIQNAQTIDYTQK